MAGSFSSKKVARAARTGGGRRRDLNSNIGFWAVLLVITIIGTALVVISRNERLDEGTPNTTPPLEPTESRAGDRWYQAYGIYLCDQFAPPIQSDEDPFGFETRGDGVIYIHPYQKQYAGRNATFGRFAEGVGLDLERDSFQLPGSDTRYESGETKCGEETGEVVAKVWDDVSDPASGEVRRGDPREILLEDRGAIVLAFVPEGKAGDIPLPPSAANLEQAAATDQGGAAAGGPGGDVPVDPAAQGAPAGAAPIPNPVAPAAP